MGKLWVTKGMSESEMNEASGEMKGELREV